MFSHADDVGGFWQSAVWFWQFDSAVILVGHFISATKERRPHDHLIAESFGKFI